MGNALYYCITFSNWSRSDIINFWYTLITGLGILINSGIALYIVSNIQKNQVNKRLIKDHLISEIKDIRNDYKDLLSNLTNGVILPSSILPWFKLMNIKINDIMSLAKKKYNVETDYLKPYTDDLRDLITENKEFEAIFNSTTSVSLSNGFRMNIIAFQQKHNHLFNELVIDVNDA